MLVATRPYRIFAFGMIFQNCDAKIVTIIHFPKSPPQLLTKFEGVLYEGKVYEGGDWQSPLRGTISLLPPVGAQRLRGTAEPTTLLVRVPTGDDIIVNPRRSIATPGDVESLPLSNSPHRGRYYFRYRSSQTFPDRYDSCLISSSYPYTP